jgi:hypothetical protein
LNQEYGHREHSANACIYFAVLHRLSKMLEMNICMQMLAGNSKALRQLLHDK